MNEKTSWKPIGSNPISVLLHDRMFRRSSCNNAGGK